MHVSDPSVCVCVCVCACVREREREGERACMRGKFMGSSLSAWYESTGRGGGGEACVYTTHACVCVRVD